MASKLLIDIATLNWAYTVSLDETKEYTFGVGDSNTVRLPAGTASREHAKLSFSGTWNLADCGSESGTFVNGQPISTQPLKNGDILKIGKCEAVYQGTTAPATGRDEWAQTMRVLEGHQAGLRDVVERARSGGGAIKMSDLDKTFVRRSHGGLGLPGRIGGDSAKLPSIFAKPEAVKPKGTSPDDLMWVAQQLSAIMAGVLSQPTSREETYKLMLQHLRDAISADNGFVMIPSEDKKRWVIRAWVGDSSEWTQYGKSHPLPLTVTNRAFQTMSVASNAFAESGSGEPINSTSMKQLNVNGYIAVPLVEDKERRGVLYFDTRKPERAFRPRDVKLLELAGACILEIEDQRS